ncbi:hypothetical protein GCM10027217_18300 [Pseudomaricurvus hydrocarbonicus]
MSDYLNVMAKRLGAEGLVVEDGMDVELHSDFGPLIEMMAEQTVAIQALADSNMLLVQAMAEADSDEVSGTELGLNGKPLI